VIGQALAHYRIESELGAGGMGVVYRAHDTHLGRSVAIKILPPGRVVDAEHKRRFTREAKAASALTHPNIITIHDINSAVPSGSADAAPVDFIVMEYIDGQSLDQVIARGPLQTEEVLGYAVEITAALAAAHATGILHRDIKPANIMLTAAGQIRVLDFGLAKLVEPAVSDPQAPTLTQTRTKEGTIVGTVAYMSPEQAEGKPLDAGTDVFLVWNRPVRNAGWTEAVSGRFATLDSHRDSSRAAAALEEGAAQRATGNSAHHFPLPGKRSRRSLPIGR